MSEDSIWGDPLNKPKLLGKLVSREQPGRGMLIGYETYQQVTRGGPNAGNTNSYVRWITVPREAGNSPEEIAKRRADLDKTDPLA